jgi:hypothetical protein
LPGRPQREGVTRAEKVDQRAFRCPFPRDCFVDCEPTAMRLPDGLEPAVDRVLAFGAHAAPAFRVAARRVHVHPWRSHRFPSVIPSTRQYQRRDK